MIFRPMDARHVHTNDRLLYRGYPSPLSCESPFHEYVVTYHLYQYITSIAVWPANLVTCALFNTLHAQTYAGMGNRGGISRERFFLYAWTAGVIWYFFPGYLFQALSYFSWICWMNPNNIVVNQLFGYISGLGMSLVTFDWAQIAFIGSPLATPWWAEANIAGGFVFFFCESSMDIICMLLTGAIVGLVVPCIYYTNTWYSKYLPCVFLLFLVLCVSRLRLDIGCRRAHRTTTPVQHIIYLVSLIQMPPSTIPLTRSTVLSLFRKHFLHSMYYSTSSYVCASTTFALSYGLSFASITATLMHAFLYFRKQIWAQSRRSMGEQPDIHARLMSKYKQVPEWWYIVIFCE